MAARSSQDLACWRRAIVRACWKHVSAWAVSGTATYHRRFEPELGHLLSAISVALQRLADNGTLGRSTCASTEVEQAVAAVDAKVTALRTAGASRDYSLEEVARFYAFLMSVKSLVKALEGPGT